MTTYYQDGGSEGALRSDYNILADRWWEQFMGVDGQWPGPRAISWIDIMTAVKMTFDNRNTVRPDDRANLDYKRVGGAPTPKAFGGTSEDVSFEPVDYGQEAQWDELWSDVRRMMANPKLGLPAVEQKYLRRSLSRLAYGLHIDLVTLLAANTGLKEDNATDSDVDCSATKWSAATTDIVGQMADAETNLGWYFDSIMMGWTAAQHLKSSSELYDRFGGNVGVGGMSWDAMRQACATFSKVRPENVLVCDDGDGLSNYVICFMYGGSMNTPNIDPEAIPSAFIGAQFEEDGAGENGIVIRTRDIDHRRHGVYAFRPCDIKVRRQYYVRLKNTY